MEEVWETWRATCDDERKEEIWFMWRERTVKNKWDLVRLREKIGL
jgi:hypothetical protein